MRPYIKEGVLQSFYLWDPRAARRIDRAPSRNFLLDGKPITDGMDVPGHGKIFHQHAGRQTVIMADPVRFTKENIDKYDFGI